MDSSARPISTPMSSEEEEISFERPKSPWNSLRFVWGSKTEHASEDVRALVEGKVLEHPVPLNQLVKFLALQWAEEDSNEKSHFSL